MRVSEGRCRRLQQARVSARLAAAKVGHQTILASREGRPRTVHPCVPNLLGQRRPVADRRQVIQQRLHILVKGGRVDGGARKVLAQPIKDVCHLRVHGLWLQKRTSVKSVGACPRHLPGRRCGDRCCPQHSRRSTGRCRNQAQGRTHASHRRQAGRNTPLYICVPLIIEYHRVQAGQTQSRLRLKLQSGPSTWVKHADEAGVGAPILPNEGRILRHARRRTGAVDTDGDCANADAAKDGDGAPRQPRHVPLCTAVNL